MKEDGMSEQEARNINPDAGLNKDEITRLGIRLVEEQGDPASGLQCFEKLLLHDPWDYLSLNNKAHCLLAMSRIEEARDACMASIIIEPRLGITWCTLGEIQATCNEICNARLCLQTALKYANGNPKIIEPAQRLLDKLSTQK